MGPECYLTSARGKPGAFYWFYVMINPKALRHTVENWFFGPEPQTHGTASISYTQNHWLSLECHCTTMLALMPGWSYCSCLNQVFRRFFFFFLVKTNYYLGFLSSKKRIVLFLVLSVADRGACLWTYIRTWEVSLKGYTYFSHTIEDTTFSVLNFCSVRRS